MTGVQTCALQTCALPISSPVRVGVRADELAGLRTRGGGSSKQGKVMVRAAVFERAPAPIESGLRATVADRGDEQLPRGGYGPSRPRTHDADRMVCEKTVHTYEIAVPSCSLK